MKALLDTNVFIGFLRNPGTRDAFDARMQRPLLFTSSIVALELFAGCQTRRQQKSLSNLLKPFEKAGRILTPDYACFLDAGRVLAELGGDGFSTAERRQIMNDVLIAVTAVKTGAVVITANKNDFSRIEKHTPVRWMLP